MTSHASHMTSHASHITSHAHLVTPPTPTPDGSSVLLVPIVSDHIEVWGPELKLSLPVDNGGQGSCDEKWAIAVTLYTCVCACAWKVCVCVCVGGGGGGGVDRSGKDEDNKYLLN